MKAIARLHIASAAIAIATLAAVPGAHALDTAQPSIYHLYVSPAGNDSNSGSAQAPFRTISKAASVARPSTTVHVAAGSYGNVVNSNSGTVNGRLRFISDNSWGAKIVGTGTEAHFTNSGNYVDIVGFDVSGSGRLGIINNGSNVTIEGNHVHHLKISGGCNGAGGAGIVNANYSASDNDIIGNDVHDIGSPGACNGVQGIYHSNLRGNIANNIVYRVSAWGIHLWHAATGVTVANNTVFSNGSASVGGGIEIGSGDAPGGIVVRDTHVVNNIIYDNPGASFTEYCYAGVSCIGSNNSVENNLLYANGRGMVLQNGTHVGTIVADPQFVNYRPDGGGDYRPGKGSPASHAGTMNHASTFDILRLVRLPGRLPSIGAFEAN